MKSAIIQQCMETVAKLHSLVNQIADYELRPYVQTQPGLAIWFSVIKAMLVGMASEVLNRVERLMGLHQQVAVTR